MIHSLTGIMVVVRLSPRILGPVKMTSDLAPAYRLLGLLEIILNEDRNIRELLSACLGNLRLACVKTHEIRHAFEVFQTFVSHFGSRQVKVLQAGKATYNYQVIVSEMGGHIEGRYAQPLKLPKPITTPLR